MSECSGCGIYDGNFLERQTKTAIDLNQCRHVYTKIQSEYSSTTQVNLLGFRLVRLNLQTQSITERTVVVF